MADVMSHNGDGGGEPPHGGATWVPGQCESAPPSRRWGPSCGLNLLKVFEGNGKQPIPINFDNKEKTYQPVGDNQKYVSRHVGNQVRNFVLPCYNKCDEVPPELRERVISSVHDFFNLQPTNYTESEYHIIIKGLERTAADRYRSYKTTVHNHFKQHGPNHPYRSINSSDWEKCVQLYTSPKFIERSEKNKVNRSQAKYPSLQGSKSFSAARYERRDRETQEWSSVIDSFETFHRRPKTGEWVNDRATLDHDKMIEMRNTQTQEAATSGTQVDEHAVVKHVLGERTGHVRGVGRIVKGSSSTSRSRTPHSTTNFQTSVEVQARFDAQDKHIRGLTEYITSMTSSLQTFLPGFQPPPPRGSQPDPSDVDEEARDDDDVFL